jgi:hemerythrin
MDAFLWKPCYVTGLVDVDEQHHRLVDVINRFGELVMREEDTSAAELESVFGELAEYASYHFTEEEALMHGAGLDPHYVAHHEQNHAMFLEEVTQLHSSAAADNRAAAKSLLQFLTHWLTYHILGSDQFMARQIEAVKSGTLPQDAFHAEAPGKDPAMDTLLTALNGLFEQVSERNRDLVQLNKSLEARGAERTLALTEANRQLDDLANTDILTGLPNRRYALQRLAREWDAALRDDRPIACMMIDADGFKIINDTHGHDAGDVVLRTLAKQLQHSVRTDDIVCRLGGDEFLVICPGTPLGGAMKLAETIRSEVASLCVQAGLGEWRGSVSVGVAARTAAMTRHEDLVKAADLGVYVAKRKGRNRVDTADQ